MNVEYIKYMNRPTFGYEEQKFQTKVDEYVSQYAGQDFCYVVMFMSSSMNVNRVNIKRYSKDYTNNLLVLEEEYNG